MVMLPVSVRNSILLTAVLAVALFAASSWYLSHERKEMRAAVEAKLGDARSAFVSFAVEIDRNKAVGDIGAVVRDCASRGEFDRTLDQLRTLPPTGLERAGVLFEACGSFFATQKGVMAIVFEQMAHELTTLYDLSTGTKEGETEAVIRDTWRRMAEVERARSQLLFEQVALQQAIIDALRARAPEVTVESIMKRVAESNTALSTYAAEADALREQEAALWERRTP